ncbi:MAG: RNB domain-containing ribonuclease [Paludibaculum sp.]
MTIDGETARDFDDAVWVDRLENGNFALHVHIADVSHYVRPGAAIDLEALAAWHQRLLSRTAPCRCFHWSSPPRSVL